MNKRRVELLAPAGDFSCFNAAINAGADAVYLAGNKFGARAYANNFTEEEIIEALRIAHIHNRKVYLTVNTLVKECEIAELIPYMRSLYEAGLDGAIIQDMGVFALLKENFPKLELHASTQMTITGIYGAELLKRQGACRVVPARELSFEEIKDIKDKTGLEIECFIHGAMCYAYSGQCLFSSILGGRSGNRGRCAGPCRLPYRDGKNNTVYPLSLKDMYTLNMIPELIEAGIDSFKIEGRMKSPEYVAGVTSMYRKYIDMYYANPDKPFSVEQKDEKVLRGLYIRSDICPGYYKQHNSKDMVTIKEPGYSGGSEDVINSIRQKYLSGSESIAINAEVDIQVGKEARITLWTDDVTVSISGDTVTEAKNSPMSVEDIEKRICKLGDTCFTMNSLNVITDGKSFMPVKLINELRRNACCELENKIIEYNKANDSVHIDNKKDMFANELLPEIEQNDSELNVSVMTFEQLSEVVTRKEVSAVYIASDLFLYKENDEKNVIRLIEKYTDKKYYLCFPHILRKRSYGYLEYLYNILTSGVFHGAVIRNHETLMWLMEKNYKGEYIADYMIYVWNKKADYVYEKLFNKITVPVELNKKEIMQLGECGRKEILVYGRLPLMYSANCIQKTLNHCLNDKSGEVLTYEVTDRYNNNFPIVQNCLHCYNILYNTVPMSLHSQYDYLKEKHFASYRIDMSLEDHYMTRKILDYYCSLWSGKDKEEFPVKEITNGHYKRGVE